MTESFDAPTPVLAGRYLIERELGRGGMATVYLARDTKHDREVAVKILFPDAAAALGSERFAREIRIAAQLNHPNILALLDSGVIDHQSRSLPFYVMPVVEGQSLRQRILHERQLPIDEALRLTREVAEALDYAHAQGVVHRDIKPENILLSRGHALVADFGVAKAVSQVGHGSGGTSVGVALGTPAYMSPEQASGERELDGRSDLYALGCVLYEMLAGEPPFTGPTAQSIVAKRFTDPVPDVRRVRDTVSEPVVSLLGRLLARSPADRFATGQQVVQAIAAIQSTPSATPAVSAPGRRWLLPALLSVAVMAAAAMLVARKKPAIRGPIEEADNSIRVLVLPLTNLGAAADENFADGISDQIRGELSRLPGITVLGRGASLRYKGTTKPAAEIGRELDVQYILGGTIQWDGSTVAKARIRISPELVRVQDETTRWQTSFDRLFEDIFTLQTDVATQAAIAIKGRLDLELADGPPPAAPPPNSSPADRVDSMPRLDAERQRGRLEAYALYLRARAEVMSYTSRRMGQALPMLQRAIVLDSTLAPAYALLAYASTFATPVDRESIGPHEPVRLARKAIALDSLEPQGWWALGAIQYRELNEFRDAEASLRRALALDPKSCPFLYELTYLLITIGRAEEALPFGRMSFEVDPIQCADVDLLPLHDLGRFDEVIALARARGAADSTSQESDVFNLEGHALLATGRHEEGLRAFAQSSRLRETSPIHYAWAYAKAGHVDQARRHLAAMLLEKDKPYVAIAATYTHLGQRDSAFIWLARGRAAGSSLVLVRRNPGLVPLRADPRFAALLAELRLPPYRPEELRHTPYP